MSASFSIRGSNRYTCVVDHDAIWLTGHNLRMAALGTYEGVIAWSRTADLLNGVFGEPVVIFQDGDVPDLE